jgi:glycine betaine/proline transport system permease protein
VQKGWGWKSFFPINRIEVGRGFEAGISIVFLAIIIDRLTHSISTDKNNDKKSN